MIHASLFSGIGGAELAANWMGWDNIFHCEINPFGRKVLDYWFPKSKSYEDITKTDFREWRGKVDVLTGGFPCFVKGTMVLTSTGYKPIEGINVGDMILTKEGDWYPCNSVMSQQKSDMVYLKAQGMYEKMATTSNHPFFVKDETGRCLWKEAGKLIKGDRVAYRCIEGRDYSFTVAFWRLVGRYLGDGWILDGKRKSNILKGHRGSRINSFNHKVVICCSKGEAEELYDIISEAGYKATKVEERTTIKYIICSKQLAGFLSNFGRYAYGKRLTGQCFNLETERKRSLYEGYLSADGYEKNGKMITSTASAELALGISQIARDIYHRAVSVSKKISRRRCVIEGREVNERPSYCVAVSPNERYAYYEDGFIWCLIKEIENRNEQRTVYNIGVEGSETYTANGAVVHNCQPFSQAGKRGGDTDDRYLWPEMLRVIREIQPTWVVGENVAGITSMVESGEDVEMGRGTDIFDENIIYRKEQEFTIERICKDFEREGYSVQPIVIPACAVGAPHRRDRVWFIARRGAGFITNATSHGGYRIPASSSEETGRPNGEKAEQFAKRRKIRATTDTESPRSKGKLLERPSKIQSFGQDSRIIQPDWRNFPTQSPICCGNDGISDRLDGITFPKWRAESIKAYGNAWVPQVAYEIFKAISNTTQ